MSSAEKRMAVPMPASPPLPEERCSRVKRLFTELEAVSEAEIVKEEVAVIVEPVNPP